MDFIPSHKRAQTKTHSPWFAAQNLHPLLPQQQCILIAVSTQASNLSDESGDAKQRISSYPLFLATLIEKLDLYRCFTIGQHFPVLVYRLAKNFSSRSTKKAPIIHLESCHGNFENLGHWHTSRLRGRNSYTGTNSDSTFTQRAKITKNQNEKWSLVSASATISYKVKKN